MKLVEKKCPNCGANLVFDKSDNEITCKYCKTSYEIEREKNLEEMLDTAFSSADYILHKKMINKFSKGVFIISSIIFIVIFIFFIIMFFGVFSKIRG